MYNVYGTKQYEKVCVQHSIQCLIYVSLTESFQWLNV